MLSNVMYRPATRNFFLVKKEKLDSLKIGKKFETFREFNSRMTKLFICLRENC